MTTPQDSTNSTERAPRPSGSPPDEPRRASGPERQNTMPPRRSWLWFALILLANFLLVRFLFPGPEAPVEVPYTFFKEEVRAGTVEAIYRQGDSVEGRFEGPVTYPPKGQRASEAGSTEPRTSEMFTTVLPSFVDPGLEELLINNGVEISAEPIQEGGSPWSTLLFAFGPALLLIGGYIWLYRRAQQQGGGVGGALTSVGRSRARRYDQESETRVTFDDVAGIDEAENELVEIVDFLMDPKKYTRLGGAAPKGVLLVGPPGTRKPRAGPLQAGARERPGDHLHRRARLDRPHPRPGGGGGIERAGADPQPDPHRDGRLLQQGGCDRARRNQPARRARQGAPEARALRPARGGEPARQGGPRGDPQGPHQKRAARGRRRSGGARILNTRSLGSRHQEPGQRGS